MEAVKPKVLGRDGHLYTREEYIKKYQVLPPGGNVTEEDLKLLDRMAKGKR